MIFTSYFDNVRNLPDCILPISIARKTPEWFKGPKYLKLGPYREFWDIWKAKRDDDYYICEYKSCVLNGLNARDTFLDLYEQAYLYTLEHPELCKKITKVCLLCYEKPNRFCHRHIVSDWFNEHGIQCEEWNEYKKDFYAENDDAIKESLVRMEEEKQLKRMLKL